MAKGLIYTINSQGNGFVALLEGTNQVMGGATLNGWTVQQIINKADGSATMIATHRLYGQRSMSIPKGSTGRYE